MAQLKSIALITGTDLFIVSVYSLYSLHIFILHILSDELAINVPLICTIYKLSFSTNQACHTIINPPLQNYRYPMNIHNLSHILHHKIETASSVGSLRD